MSGVQGAFDDRGTRLYAMSGYTGHKHGILDYDNPATLQQDNNGKIPGKYICSYLTEVIPIIVLFHA